MQTSNHKGILLPLLPLFLELPSPSESQGCNLRDNAPPALHLLSVDCILAVCLGMPTLLEASYSAWTGSIFVCHVSGLAWKLQQKS